MRKNKYKHMKRLLYFLILLISTTITNAQVVYEEVNSSILGESRQIKIQLPRNYEESDKKYPIVFVMDADYLFEIVAGNVDYYSYWEDIPESIVVGINQIDKREADCLYSEQNSLPMETGSKFFEFVGMELIPYVERNYRTESFRVAIGHGVSANFINYWMLKPIPLFQAYVSISPDLAPDMTQFLTERIGTLKEGKTFYYLATSDSDVKRIRAETEALNKSISSIDNKSVLRTYDMLKGPSHYSLPAHAIPKALESIFLVFQPISKREYKEVILELDGSPVDYLIEKYTTIKELFGIDKKILINDFKAVAAAIKKKEKWEYYETLGSLARKQYPETLLGTYYMARFFEETGEPKKAMKAYQNGYVLNEIGGITKDRMLEQAEQIKADFGY